MNEMHIMTFAIVALIIIVIYLLLVIKGQKRIMNISKKDHERILGINELAYQMILIDVEGQPLRKKIEELNINSIAIYGMGELGERIMNDIILNTSLELMYGMDRDASEKKMVIPVYTLEEAKRQKKPDMILLTTYSKDDSIKKLIQEEMGTMVYSLKEIIYAK